MPTATPTPVRTRSAPLAIDLVRPGQPSRRAASGRDRAAEHGRQKALEARWGSQAAAKLELARGMIREAEVKWPGLMNYLNATSGSLVASAFIHRIDLSYYFGDRMADLVANDPLAPANLDRRISRG
jgi:hypothetical protein